MKQRIQLQWYKRSLPSAICCNEVDYQNKDKWRVLQGHEITLTNKIAMLSFLYENTL